MTTIQIDNLDINMIIELQQHFGNDITIKNANPPQQPTMFRDSSLMDAIINHSGNIADGLLIAFIYDLLKKHGVKDTMINKQKIIINDITAQQFVTIVINQDKTKNDEDSTKNIEP